MIQSITLVTQSLREKQSVSVHQAKTTIDCSIVMEQQLNSFDVLIEFDQPIILFRNHDYTWVDVRSDRVANAFCPKIIQLQNGFLVQANLTSGIWEVHAKKPNELVWRFNPEFSQPICSYQGEKSFKRIDTASVHWNFETMPALLFSQSEAIEFSRSKIPFSAIACFTDHCDFDTAQNVQLQREFFKKNEVKVTKGFFLNHFSKREDNSSMERDAAELVQWQNDGHELAYHSLSQSLKSDEESMNDFKEFVPPNGVTTWIDHGFQPYNFTLYERSGLSAVEYESILKRKKINVVWNYIDSGTATTGMINQLNREQFTLKNVADGSKNLKFITRIQLIIKSFLFHYHTSEAYIHNYKSLATDFKKIIYNKKITALFSLIKNGAKLFVPLCVLALNWKKSSKKSFPLANYSPLLFKHTISNEPIYVFQTLEMVDFKKSLSQQNIDLLVKEKGVFIAHTYFSVPLKYHIGKMFDSEYQINPKVTENFDYLHRKIAETEIWNPTLNELVAYWSSYEKVQLDCDDEGKIYPINTNQIAFRTLTV
jgi:hypothetical protein